MEQFLNPWVIVGVVGQLLFLGRFLIQWIHSERRGESVVPVYFWYFSVAGGLILFAYALHIRDVVFSFGQGVAVFIYLRNLMLIQKSKKKLENEKTKY